MAARKAMVTVVAHSAVLLLLAFPVAAFAAYKLHSARQGQAHTAEKVSTRERGEDRQRALYIFFYLVAN